MPPHTNPHDLGSPGGGVPVETEDGIIFGATPTTPAGDAEVAAQALGGVPVLPPWPGNLVRPVLVPRRPRLPVDVNDEALAQAVAAAFREAVRAETGKPCGVLARREHAKRYKGYAELVAAGKLMREHDVPAAAWFQWRLRAWVRYGKKPESMPLRWAVNPESVDKFAGWFRHETIDGGRVLAGRIHRDLCRRWELARADVRQGAAPAEALERHFPVPLSYGSMLADAKREAKTIAARVNFLLAKGVDVWDHEVLDPKLGGLVR